MPIFDPRERSVPVLPTIIIANLFPLVGIIYFNLSFFALFYLFWWETGIISFYQWLKMGKAKKNADPDPGFTINGKTLTHEQVNSKRYMRRMYFWVRFFMLGFYLIFIIVFVGLLASNQSDDMLGFLNALFLMDPWMRYSLLAFILTHGIEYWVWLRDEDYNNTSLRELGSPFDGRVLIMHLVIVLGTFGSVFVTEKLMPGNPKAGSIIYATLFVLLKILLDGYSYSKNKRRPEVIMQTFTSLKK